MEEAVELANYLPLSFKTPKEQEYIEFLWDAFETNYTHGKYQFAFLAYHMLTMSFVYFNIWQIKQNEPGDFANGLIGFNKDVEKGLLAATSPFSFSVVQELKTSSSKWVKTQSPDLAAFSWQRGYGCFSVGPSDVDVLRAYIDDQENHHRTRTFQDEFRMFLKKYGVEYDEAYVWD